MNKINLVLKYFNYLISAKSKHGIHSPFVYKLLTETINGKSNSKEVKEIEDLRKKLCQDTRLIEITDLGAGSNINNIKTRLVKDIAKNSAKSQKYGQLLYRLVKDFKAKTTIELGTSLGISSCYLSKANKENKVYTLEGCPETARKAQENFDLLKIKNAEIIVGDFKNNLSPTLEKIKSLDFGFIDGNHQEHPTIEYFEKCLEFCHHDSVLVFDDIHWSEGMERAWTYVKNHNQVFVTIDLFFIGLVFLNPKQKKEHFIIRH